MTSYRQLTATSIVEPLRFYLGNREGTLIAGDQYLCEDVVPGLAGARYPDLMIAFDADLDAHRRSNGYVIAEQGKAPDFVLEIASRWTGREDVGDKRGDYARMGVLEYWRFDETARGEWHGARLAGDRLGADGGYDEIEVADLGGGVLEGYSGVLNVCLRWDGGRLGWHDPVTGLHIATFADERARADWEREGRLAAQENVDRERGGRLRAEARARELEAELENLRNR